VMQGAPLAKATSAAPAAGGTTADVPKSGRTSAVAQAEMDHMMGGEWGTLRCPNNLAAMPWR